MHISPTNPKIGILILAGGQGSRMNFKNKGLVLLKQKLFIHHLIDSFEKEANYLAISANQNISEYQKFGFPIFTDANPWQNIGPLGGIISAIKNFPDDLDAIQIIPCDTPLLPSEMIQTFKHALFEAPTLLAANHQNHSNNLLPEVVYAQTESLIHPSIFMFKTHLHQGLAHQHLETHLTHSRHSLRSWIFSLTHRSVYFSNEGAFTNINDPATLTQCESLP